MTASGLGTLARHGVEEAQRGLDPTTQVLIEIRDEVRRTNERLEQTNERLFSLERRQTETEVRLATELVAVGKR